jgi:hypothetical protein
MLPTPYSVVLDIESLCRKPTAAFHEIGAVLFERTTFTPIEIFQAFPDIPDQIILGRTIDPDTLTFHRLQKTLPSQWAGEPFHDALHRFYSWIRQHQPKHVWIQGTCFDRPMIENAFDQVHLPLPWKFSRSRDARTTWNNAFPDKSHDTRPHRGLADCQATLADIAAAFRHCNLSHEAA